VAAARRSGCERRWVVAARRGSERRRVGGSKGTGAQLFVGKSGASPVTLEHTQTTQGVKVGELRCWESAMQAQALAAAAAAVAAAAVAAAGSSGQISLFSPPFLLFSSSHA
jgi:hypothetical protein